MAVIDPTQQPMDERTAFERWLPHHLMPTEYSHDFLFARNGDGYERAFVDDIWQGWKARAAQASQLPESNRQTDNSELDDPADLWDRYCAETPAKRRSPQGAMAFAFDAITSKPVSHRVSEPAQAEASGEDVAEILKELREPVDFAGTDPLMIRAAALIERLAAQPQADGVREALERLLRVADAHDASSWNWESAETVENAYAALASEGKPEREGILWCCHVRGPDDVCAAPDYATALAWSDTLNALNWKVDELRYPKPRSFENPSSYQECLVKAVPAIWPYSPQAHAEDLPKSIAGFADPRSLPSTNRGSAS